MDRDPYVLKQNIARYKRLLADEQDEERKRMIRRLLAEAETKARQQDDALPK